MKLMFRFSMLVFLILSACSTPVTVTSTARPTKIQPTNTATPRPTRTPRPVSVQACVTDSTIRIRSGPGTDHEVIGGMVSGTCMSILGRNQDSSWVYMVTDDDKKGWVAASLLTIDGNVQQVSITSELGVANIVTTSTTVPQQAPTNTPRPPATRTPRPPATNTPRLVVPVSELLCSQTAGKVGDYVTCKIEGAYCDYLPSVDGAPTFCNDRPYPNQNFALVVWGADWSQLDGYCIKVSGTVYLYKGVPQIEATSSSQVSSCD